MHWSRLLGDRVESFSQVAIVLVAGNDRRSSTFGGRGFFASQLVHQRIAWIGIETPFVGICGAQE